MLSSIDTRAFTTVCAININRLSCWYRIKCLTCDAAAAGLAARYDFLCAPDQRHMSAWCSASSQDFPFPHEAIFLNCAGL